MLAPQENIYIFSLASLNLILHEPQSLTRQNLNSLALFYESIDRLVYPSGPKDSDYAALETNHGHFHLVSPLYSKDIDCCTCI